MADTRRLRKASWLALVSLAWLQLMLASHPFDHVAEYFDDSCHVCVQLDRTDDVAVDHVAPVATSVAHADLTVHREAGLVPSAFERGFQSRAPPRT